jgi:hypothetical protein
MTSETKGLKRDAAELRATIRAYMRCLDEEIARAEASEARCARLTELLREMTGWSDKQIEEGIQSTFAALSDYEASRTGQTTEALEAARDRR